MRRARSIALWSLGVLLLVVSAAAVFLAVAGDDFYRWAMRQAVEGTMDRELHVDGSFSFEVGLEPTLTVTDVWIGNAPWADTKELVRAQSVEVQVALMPLFSGIVRIPRLAVEGLNLDLETSVDGEKNWRVTSMERKSDGPGPAAPALPLFGVVFLKDIAVTYRDRLSGRDTEILLAYLDKDVVDEDASFELRGEGSFNRRPFRINGRFGSIEEALTATAPYPMKLTLQSSSLVVDLAGSARNVASVEGFDLNLSIRTPSVGEVLRTFEIDLPLVGLAETSARLQGDLDSLTAEDITIEVIDRSGQELHAEGRLADLTRGRGLDLRFEAKLGPDALSLVGDLPPRLSGILEGAARLDLTGRAAGNVEAPVLKELNARLEDGSGAQLTLEGHAELDYTDDGKGLVSFEAETSLSLPDRALLERALGTGLPDLGAIRASADLALADDWVTLRSAGLEIEALEHLQFDAEGRIGKLSGRDFAFEPNPTIDLSAAIDHSRPLVFLYEQLVEAGKPETDPSPDTPVQEPAPGPGENLVLLVQQALISAGSDPGPPDGKMGPRTRAAIEEYQARHGLAVDGRATADLLRHLQGTVDRAGGQASAAPTQFSDLAERLPELGPVAAALKLSREDGAYRLDALNLAFGGAKDGLRVDVTGSLGSLRPAHDVALAEIALAVDFAIPSSQMFSEFLPAGAPEFKNVRGRFAVQGSTDALSITDAGMIADGPDGLAAAVTGKDMAFSFAHGFTTTNLALGLDARWPNTTSVYRLVGLDLPDLGPVWARATLTDRGETTALTGLDVTAGAPDRPAARVTGEIGDLPALRGIKLIGEFDVATATLLGAETVPPDALLGKVHGRFDLSDTDGSLGLEALSAEIEDTKLFKLSIKGLFDDMEERNDLRMEAALSVPDVSQLGREFGFEAEQLGSLTFRGQVSGSDERFRAEGKARLGETDLTGTVSGSLKGERPALRAKLYSPQFRFVDFGLVPQDAAPVSAPEPAAQDEGRGSTGEMAFGETPVSFEALKALDLELDVLFDDLEGIHLDMDRAEGRLDITDGLMTIDPLRFNFVGGQIDLSLRADARGELPKVHIGLAGDDVDLGDFLAQSEVEVPLDGELDLLVDLEAAGQSPRALASSLDGKFDLAIEQGRVRTSLLRLTTTNPVSWMFSESARRGYSDMNCLIVRFDVQDGVAESKALLLDTPNILALGEGRIDLRDETIDIRVRPRAKRRRLVALSTPFSIRGPLTGPSVQVSTAGVSARTAGEILLSPINLLGSLLPFVSDRGRDRDNLCLTLEEGLQRE